MRTNFRLALGMVTLVVLSSNVAWGQQTGNGAKSLLPLPDVDPQLAAPPQYPVTSTAAYGQPTYGQPAYGQPLAAQRFADRRFAQNDNLQYDEDAPPAQESSQPEQVPAIDMNGQPNGGHPGQEGWDSCNLPTATGGRVWFGGVYGLSMTRYRDRSLCLSFDSAHDTYHILGTEDAAMDWNGGTEVRFGSTFCGCQWGWEVDYWGIYNNSRSATVSNDGLDGSLTTGLSFGNLDIYGTTVLDYFDTSAFHTLRREYEFNNLELNLLRFSMCGCGGGCGLYSGCNGSCCGANPCGPRFNMTGLLGIRYFKFREGLVYSSDCGCGVEANRMYYDVGTDNQLLGVQLGSRADFCATQRLSFFGETKFGLFGNHMTQAQSVRSGVGDYATINNGSYAGQDYNAASRMDDLAFLGELRVGATYQFSCHWSAVVAYRAMAVTGVALTADQIPSSFAALGMAQSIDNDGELILHGVQAGLEARF